MAARGAFSLLTRLLVFAHVTGLSPLPADPWAAPIPVRGPKGAAATKRLADCGVREVNAAIARARRPVAKPESPEASERLSRFRAPLAGILPEGQPFPVVVKEKKGVPLWSLAPMPQEVFDKVVPAIAGTWSKVPAPPDNTLQRLQDTALRAMDAAAKVNPNAQDPVKRAAFEQKLKEGLGVLRVLADQTKPG